MTKQHKPMTLIESLFGSIALVTSLIGLLPQSWKALKTRSTHDISMLMLANYILCSFAWIVYGGYIHSAFVVYSNVVGLATSLLLTFQKIYYDRAARQTV